MTDAEKRIQKIEDLNRVPIDIRRTSILIRRRETESNRLLSLSDLRAQPVVIVQSPLPRQLE